MLDRALEDLVEMICTIPVEIKVWVRCGEDDMSLTHIQLEQIKGFVSSIKPDIRIQCVNPII